MVEVAPLTQMKDRGGLEWERGWASSFSKAAITKHHGQGGLNNRHSLVLEAGKCGQGWVPSESQDGGLGSRLLPVAGRWTPLAASTHDPLYMHTSGVCLFSYGHKSY